MPGPQEVSVSSWSPERARLGLDFIAAVRKTGSLMHLMSQVAADCVGINPTDLNCLNTLSFSGQLTSGPASQGYQADHGLDYRRGRRA